VRGLIVKVVATLVANAIALLVGAIVLSKVSLSFTGFLTSLVIFTVVVLVADPLIRGLADGKSSVVVALSSLIATLVSLVVTKLLGDSLQIRGVFTWVFATVLVWAVSAVLRFVILRVADQEPTADPN
jgi:hypothetical protein